MRHSRPRVTAVSSESLAHSRTQDGQALQAAAQDWDSRNSIRFRQSIRLLQIAAEIDGKTVVLVIDLREYP